MLCNHFSIFMIKFILLLFILVFISEYKCWPNIFKEKRRIKKINQRLEREKKKSI